MKNKYKSYGFWTALAGAVVMLLNSLGQAFGFSIDDKLVTDIIMAVAGLLVVFGIVSMPNQKDSGKSSEEEVSQEDSQDKSSQSENNMASDDEKDDK